MPEPRRVGQDSPGVGDDVSLAELRALGEEVASCRRCPRLVQWREDIAANAQALKAPEPYWAKGVPGFGDPQAKLLIVGLAPAAKGANRTGRMFTGDRSGTFLFGALHRFGYANHATSTDKNDGLVLNGCYVTGAVRCAPPENRPTPQERDNCAPYLSRELALLENVTVILALGMFAFDAVLRQASITALQTKRPRFAHGLEVALSSDHGRRTLIASYHPSQRNVFTGLLSEASFDAVFERIHALGA